MLEEVLGPKAILVLGDSPFQTKVLRTQLEQCGPFDVLEARALSEAAHILRTRGADIFLVLSDLNLPDAPNGEAVDLCLAWRVPIMVLTATFDEKLRQSLMQCRVLDCFLKGGLQQMQPLLHSVQRIYKNQAVNVLLVDSDDQQRGYLRDLLHVQRLNVLEAVDGLDALDALREVPDIHLVITDHYLPRMDGTELLKELRRHHPRESMGIVPMVGEDSVLLASQLLRLGANACLCRPFTAEEFSWRINDVLDCLDAQGAAAPA